MNHSDRKQSPEIQQDINVLDFIHEIVFTLDTDLRHTGVYGRWVEEQGLKPDFFRSGVIYNPKSGRVDGWPNRS
jgi:hypothetical protein